MTSLAELRMIEEQRVVHERAARIAEEDARRAAIVHAEQRARDEQAAQLAEERRAALAIEEARHAAEREARLRVEATEAAERARHQAALDEARLAQELDIARELARRTKPRWMIAVTVGAVLAASVLTWFAIDQMRAASEADRVAQEARDASAAAKANMKSLGEQVAGLDSQSAVMARDLDKARQDLASAETAAARAASDKRLRELAVQQRELERQRQLAKQRLEQSIRVRPIQIKQECLDGVIGRKGC